MPEQEFPHGPVLGGLTPETDSTDYFKGHTAAHEALKDDPHATDVLNSIKLVEDGVNEHGVPVYKDATTGEIVNVDMLDRGAQEALAEYRKGVRL